MESDELIFVIPFLAEIVFGALIKIIFCFLNLLEGYSRNVIRTLKPNYERKKEQERKDKE